MALEDLDGQIACVYIFYCSLARTDEEYSFCCQKNKEPKELSQRFSSPKGKGKDPSFEAWRGIEKVWTLSLICLSLTLSFFLARIVCTIVGQGQSHSTFWKRQPLANHCAYDNSSSEITAISTITGQSLFSVKEAIVLPMNVLTIVALAAYYFHFAQWLNQSTLL